MNAGVYRVYDTAGRLLYVGSSVDVPSRLATHERETAWWIYQARIEVTDYTDKAAALAAEAEAIATEHPRWNMAGRSPAHPDGPATSYRNAPWLEYERDHAVKVRKLRASRDQLDAELTRVEIELQHAEALVAFISSQSLEDPGDIRERKRAALRTVRGESS